MKIALDYDNTYTAAPEMWTRVVETMHAFGHTVYVVTARDERYDNTTGLIELATRLPVIYCRGVAKRWFCHHFGPDIDIWIDDKPESILENSATHRDALAEWRAGERP